jgi:hypothetical protein
MNMKTKGRAGRVCGALNRWGVGAVDAGIGQSAGDTTRWELGSSGNSVRETHDKVA